MDLLLLSPQGGIYHGRVLDSSSSTRCHFHSFLRRRMVIVQNNERCCVVVVLAVFFVYTILWYIDLWACDILAAWTVSSVDNPKGVGCLGTISHHDGTYWPAHCCGRVHKCAYQCSKITGKSPFQTCTTLAHPYTYARWHDGWRNHRRNNWRRGACRRRILEDPFWARLCPNSDQEHLVCTSRVKSTLALFRQRLLTLLSEKSIHPTKPTVALFCRSGATSLAVHSVIWLNPSNNRCNVWGTALLLMVE